MSSFILLELLEILWEDMFCVTAPSGGSLLLRGFVLFFKENLYGTNFEYAWNNFIVDIFYVLFYF